MIVINACLYSSDLLGSSESKKLIESLKSSYVEKYITIYTFPKLMGELIANVDKEIILFSNFPTDFNYENNGFSRIEIESGQHSLANWSAKHYGMSAKFFSGIFENNKLKAVHFITGAKKDKLTDEAIFSLTGDIPVTIKRKQDWAKPGMNYELFWRLYMEEKIRNYD